MDPAMDLIQEVVMGENLATQVDHVQVDLRNQIAEIPEITKRPQCQS